MAFCDIRFKRKTDGTIQVKDKRGEQSLLYSKLVEHVQQNGVPQDSMWYFDKLKEQKKLKSDDPYELALGLYSIAFHSDKSEKYWVNRIQDLIGLIKPLLNDKSIEPEELEEESISTVSFEEKVQSEHKELLDKYGTGFGNEINPHSNWPKLTSDISNSNKLFGEKRLTLYQSPDGKWRLRSIQPQTTFIETKVDYAVSNSLEFKVELSDFQKELLDNWDNYFQGYSDLSDSDKLEFIKLAEQGQLEISCKI